MSTNDVLSKLKAEIEKRNLTNYCGTAEQYEEELFAIIDSLQQEQPCDTCTNDKGCVTCNDGELWEGKEQEPEVDLSIKDVELLHTFLYAVKNNKQGVFTFTRLSDEQYQEVLRRFKNAK